MFKPMLFAFAIVLFGMTAWSASGPVAQEGASAPASVQSNPVKPTAQSQARAKQIYGIDCAVCHGANGNGKTELASDMQLSLDDWTNPKALAAKPDGELFKIIRNGKDKMPPEDTGRANDNEVWNLILYIRGLSKQQPVVTPTSSN